MNRTEPREPTPLPQDQRPSLERHRLVRAGVYAWSAAGLVLLLVLAVQLLGMLRLVIVPLVITLFPAALLTPVSSWLKQRG